ncbi:MAG: hypothetical protein E6772_04625 [Dysgonomonas sp.]|nr:hypothetical protein [Dysgonomonas sp.]
MNERNIDYIIEQLEDEYSDVPSYFGLYKSNSETAEENDVYILANEQGAIRFVSELLESVTSRERDEKGFSRIELSELVKEGDFNLKYIKTSLDNKVESKSYLDDYESFSDKMWKYGCFSLVFIFIVFFVCGLVSVSKMVYNLF